MKTTNLLFVLCGVIALASCNRTELKPNDIYVLVDNTEKIGSREALMPTENVLKMMNDGGSVTWQQVNNVSLNPNKTIEVNIPNNPTQTLRDDALKPFKEEFETIRKEFLAPVEKEAENSSIYKPLCQAITQLNKSKAKKKVLVIFSDMIENSIYGNWYKKGQTFEQIKTRLDSSGIEIPKETSNISIMIIYHPDNQKHEENHQRVMKFWGKLFEEADIPYEVRANF